MAFASQDRAYKQPAIQELPAHHASGADPEPVFTNKLHVQVMLITAVRGGHDIPVTNGLPCY